MEQKVNHTVAETVGVKKTKKAWYKRWYMLAFLLVFVVGCGSDATTSSGGNSDTPTEETASSETPQAETKATYHVGETIAVETSSGKYNFTITGIAETTERNQFSETQADRVVIIDYTYENIDQESDLFISDMSFKAYDASGSALATYPVTTTYAQGVGAGRNTSAQMAFALNNETNEIELEYYDNMFNSKSDAIIVLTW